jgi:hypothetical protein
VGSPFQQQSRRRKLIYTGLIIALFCGSLILRQASGFGLEAQAANLELREADRGEVALTDSALQLTLTGARGAVVCYLWYTANEAQKRHEWNELELIVRTLTKLQPHFISPWLFQSWNIAYNVSVESDSIRDKYFFIAHGIQLLAEGERRNRNNPDLRFNMGFYNQHKIGISDEANTLRSLYQMSCIDPAKRDPKRFRGSGTDGNQAVDLVKFEQFCQENPMLVRRLRDALKRDTPAAIVDFLEENKDIPSIYEDKPVAASGGGEPVYRRKSRDDQFPILPPPDPTGRRQVDIDAADFENHHCSREWYLYANEPLPPPDRELSMNPFPRSFDPHKHRMPRYMASAIFRGYPSRAQGYIAETLESEGWFDSEGWKITGWFPEDRFSNETEAAVGTGKAWAADAWERTRRMWQDHGVATGLYLTPEELNSLETKADKLRKRYHLRREDVPTSIKADLSDPEMMEAARSHSWIYWYDQYRVMTNFPHFYYQSQVEADPKTVAVRKAFFEANHYRKAADLRLAMQTYQEAFPRWRDILVANPEFAADQTQQEDTYEIVADYLMMVLNNYGLSIKELMATQDYMTHVAATPFHNGIWVPRSYFVRGMDPNIKTPLDENRPDGTPLISWESKMMVRARKKLPTPPPPESMMERYKTEGATRQRQTPPALQP